MTTEEFHRKLTAILSADVQGYSRLMEDDEESTIHTLTDYRDLMSVLIQRHQGRVVDSPGDNLLAQFESLTDAVHCAVEIQEELRLRNADLPDNRKMHFRIGINLGEIIEDKDRIYGDGVNVAARVECLAEGGGICISGAVYDAIKNKLAMSYEFMGEHNVKNIKEPVRVYRIKVEPEGATAAGQEKRAGLRTWQTAAIVVGVFILGVVAYILLDRFYIDRQTVKPEVVTNVSEQAPSVVNEAKEKKSIAVLPFVNMSPDPDQEYFADGLSEELLNALAQIPDLTVIARTSAFSFKGTTKKVQEIANELSVDYILEGSVRKSGDALRITAQLVKGVDGSHLWSKIYDRELKDIFEVQEDIATAVASELKATLGVGKSLKQLGGTDNEEAYELYLRAIGQVYQVDDQGESLSLKSIEAAIALDPKFALAWAEKAYYHNYEAIFGPANRAVTEKDAALSAALKAIELEPNLADGYAALGYVRLSKGEFLEAGSAYRKAFELTTGPFYYGDLLMDVGFLKKAHEQVEAAWRNDPLNEVYRFTLIESFSYLGDIQSAEREYENARAIYGDDFAFNLQITMARLGSGQAVSSDDILVSSPIHNTAKEHLDSPKDGLVELYRFFNDNEYQDAGSFSQIFIWAAYFHDPELAMDALEKVVNVDAGAINNCWRPIMKQVRQTARFKELVKKIGLVDYWQQFGWPDICRPLDNGDFVCD